MGNKSKKWSSRTVIELQRDGIILVEDGNHGEYRPRPNEFSTIGTSFIRAADMAGGRVLFESAQKISDIAMQRIRKGIGAGGDVILSHKGTVGKVAYVPLDAQPFVCSPQTTFWRTLDNDKIDRRYLFSFLNSQNFKDQLYSLANETDMAGYVSLTSQRGLIVDLPPIEKQRSIAHILGSLDDKIELNRQMNATLKGMAQALFKSWFVDFDPVIDNALAAGNPIPEAFAARAQTRRKALAHGTANRDIAKQFPTAFQFTEEMRWIPEGWEVKQIKEFGKIICGKTPSKKNEKYYGKDVPFIKIPDMHNNVWITEAIDSLSFEGAKSQQKKEIPPNSICVSCIATVGKVSITSAISQTNQQINSVVPNHSCSTYYLYFSFSGMGKKLIDLASGGSATLNLNTGDFSKIDIISPPTELLSGYHETIKKLFNKILSSEYQSKSLANLRDTLLPKLISGEIRIPEAEKLTEKALA